MKIACAKCQGNRFIIDGEIDEKHGLQKYQNECGLAKGFRKPLAKCGPGYSEPATPSVVADHCTRIQLKPRIYSIGGFKAM